MRIADIEIRGLTEDSRAVEPGFLFAALPGSKADGAAFIAEAARKGAVAVLAPKGTKPTGSLPIIEDALPRRRFARMAAAFYGAQPETMAAVTGTSGKSSTVSFARQIWKALGRSSASLGTLGIDSDPIQRYSGLTTADPVRLHADLAELARAGVTHAAMEASSHGLDQYRLDGVTVKAAGFTSFGRDHLDYHATADAYFAAKARLFTEVLQPGGTAVLNADIPEFDRLRKLARGAGHPVISYGEHGKELRIVERRATAIGQSVTLELFGQRCAIAFPLVGAFQLMNALCALGLMTATGADAASAADALEKLQGVRGRLERVARLANGAAVYVDYAHKPDALETVLNALRPHTDGKLVIVFGCGGDRDRGKRPIMGEIATRLADRVIVTDDNPRSEEPAAIRAQILAGAPGAVEIGDRAEAIEAAVKALRPGDVLVVAGKGHEQGQIVGSEARPFDDAAVVRDSVARLDS
ncbi:MAG TPA: UDP-N-acetylmuramoyl-L-alanyl-D-glutamate--2,6-diaminopimelate ligase [Alphaproteobacteria bacterium]|nr:UDP-N-acetylmuramoyl-L-alanyl-D-glutamate--2,6-diaminopimelate ligase [Alphaproteobacteria bacterium]